MLGKSRRGIPGALSIRPGLLKIVLACVLAAGGFGSTWAQEYAFAPYMATASNPAMLSAPGELWLRFGVLSTHGGEERQRTSTPVRVLYAFTENIGLRIDFEPWVSLTEQDGTRIRGASDPTVLLRLSRSLPGEQAVTLEAGIKTAIAKTGLGSGRDDYVLNGIYSRDYGKYSVDVNFGYTRLGTASPGESRSQFPWFIDIFRPIDDVWMTTFELSGTNQSGTRPISEMLAALSYSLSKQVILVGKVAFGLTDRAPDRTVGFNVIMTFK